MNTITWTSPYRVVRCVSLFSVFVSRVGCYLMLLFSLFDQIAVVFADAHINQITIQA